MKNRETSILLLSRTQSVLDDVTRAVGTVPDVALRAQRSSLVEVNGHAAELAAGSDIVMFEVDARQKTDFDAVQRLIDVRGGSGLLVALSDGDLPLSAARALQNAGVDEIVPLPCSDEELALLLRKARREGAAEAGLDSSAGREGSIIAVSRARGGIGATTIAVNLASLLQDRRGVLRKQATKRVAIVDFELQFGNVGIFLDVEDRGAMLELARSANLPDRAFVRTAMIQRKCGLSVLPAPARPVPLHALDPGKVGALLDALRAEYDYVVIDMPHALVDWIEPVLGRARKILVATDTTVPGVRHARRMIGSYAEEAPVLPVELVVVHEKRPMFLSGQQKEAAKVLERPLTHWLPHDERAAIDAMDRGEPVVEMRGSCELSKAFRKMAKTVAKSLASQPATNNAQH